jgi:RNA polymerase subunit RPABC4/transcription elongation factor Spt4
MFCKKCGKEITDGTTVCPVCGYKNNRTAKKRSPLISVLTWFGIVLIAIVSSLAIAVISNTAEGTRLQFILVIKVNVHLCNIYCSKNHRLVLCRPIFYVRNEAFNAVQIPFKGNADFMILCSEQSQGICT